MLDRDGYPAGVPCAIVATAKELGATVRVPPTDAPWVRTTVIADPQGTVFTVSQFVPPS